MKLVSMKRADDDDMDTISYSAPNYGYGLSICLNEDQCEALGITKALRAGSKVSISGVGIVTSSTESVTREAGESGSDITLTIQLTEMGLQQQGKISNASAILYGDD